jgi:predicted nucleic acid-binding protein
MYLIDTDVISEMRKGSRANPGVQTFFQDAASEDIPLYLSAVTIGELRQGAESIRHRGDSAQADILETWLNSLCEDYADSILPLDAETAHVWGRLRVPYAENPLDKQIAATALLNQLTVVTRNTSHYAPTGVPLMNPFT